ncbi:ANL family adenylate-forming protein [Streptacidiphilus sp. PAMC 29251]
MGTRHWTPSASVVLHLENGGTETLRPADIGTSILRIRERYREVPDESECLVPGVAAGFARYLLEFLSALGLPNPVVIPEPDGGPGVLPTLERLATLGLAARSLESGQRLAPAPGTRPMTLPPAALLLRTGGTSGRVRYAVNTTMRPALQRDRRLSLASSVGLKAGMRVCLAGSVRHAATVSMLLDALNHPVEIHLFEKPDPARILREVQENRIEWMLATPFHMRMMKRQLAQTKDDLCLRTLVHMSAACPASLKRFWHERLGPGNVYEIFGSSEGIGTSVARGDEWESRPGTVGMGFYTSIAVMDSEDRPVAPGVVGDVYFRAGGSARDLHIGHGDAVKWRRNGYVSIGDQGRLDDDGYLFLEPRSQARITVGGVTVLATDVEDALMDVAWVQDAAAVGMPNPVTGQRVACCVVLGPGSPVNGLAALASDLRRRLPPAAVPRKLVQVDAVPRSTAGKINRSLVLEMLDEEIRET